MKKMLKGLNENIGIRGSFVMTRDGVVVEACLSGALDQETIAALASSLLMVILKPTSSFHIGDPSRILLSISLPMRLLSSERLKFVLYSNPREKDLENW